MNKITNVTKTASGSVLGISDARRGPASDVKVVITPVYGGSGTPSMTNVRPISGHTGLTLVDMKTAIYADMDLPSASAKQNGVTLAVRDGKTLSVSGTGTGHASLSVTLDTPIIVPANEVVSLYLYGSSFTGNVSVSVNDIIHFDDPIPHVNFMGTLTDGPLVMSDTEEWEIGDLQFSVSSSGSYSVEGVLCLIKGRPAPDTVSTLDIDWTDDEGTVYGGTLDVTTGVLTIDSMVYTVSALPNLARAGALTNNWRSTIIRISSSTIFEGPNRNTFSDWLPLGAQSYTKDETGYYLADTRSLYIKLPKSEFADLEAINTYLGDHPLHIWIGSLLNPRTVQLTAEQVALFAGENGLFSSTGDVELTYESAEYADLSDILVCDRTADDVERVKTLKRQILTEGFSSLTADEQAEYMAGMRGAYNAEDMNRVGRVVEYVADCMNRSLTDLEAFRDDNAVAPDPALMMPYSAVTVSPKTNWTVSGIPSASQAKTYLQNIAKLRALLPLPSDTPYVPADLNNLSYETANVIERVLLAIFDAFTAKEAELYSLTERATLDRVFSDEVYADEF